ncbi:MAG: hypothetical protein ACUVYA_04805 [Planctomycetota bacterium]
MRSNSAAVLSLVFSVAGCRFEGPEGPCAPGSRAVNFARYLPSDPASLGKRNFHYSYGAGADFSVRVIGTEDVPYRQGTITGSLLSGPGGAAGTWTVRSTRREVKVLAVGDRFYSWDVFLWEHPPSWSFSTLCAPGIVEIGRFYRIPKDAVGDPTKAELDVKTQILVELQDVTVPAGAYADALILWHFDKTVRFAPLDFHGKDAELGIALPSGSTTTGALASFWVYGIEAAATPPTSGPIAVGEVQAATGSLLWLAVLTSVEAP